MQVRFVGVIVNLRSSTSTKIYEWKTRLERRTFLVANTEYKLTIIDDKIPMDTRHVFIHFKKNKAITIWESRLSRINKISSHEIVNFDVQNWSIYVTKIGSRIKLCV